MDVSKLAVCTMVSNPLRWASRVSLYQAFKHHVENDLGAKLWTCEVAFAGRPFEVTQTGDPYALQLRTTDEIWHKENALNALIQRLPPETEGVCWVDADVTFASRDVLTKTALQLDHHAVVQMWSNAADLNPSGRVMKVAKSFGACFYDNHWLHPVGKNDPYAYAHTGYAWAARRSTLDQLGTALGGPLLDFAPLGSADFYMAWGLIGELGSHLDWRVHQGFTGSYVDQIRQWQEAAKVVRRDVGVVEGMLSHGWHGKKAQRYYNSREQILIDNKFDPLLDLRRDTQGLWRFTDRRPRLRTDIMGYLRSRNEDSIDTE